MDDKRYKEIQSILALQPHLNKEEREERISYLQSLSDDELFREHLKIHAIFYGITQNPNPEKQNDNPRNDD